MGRNEGRKSLFAPLGLVLLCGHCSIAALVAGLGAFGLLSVPVFGVPLEWVLPPVLILGGFAAWVWSGRRAAAACPLPDDGVVSSDPHKPDSADSG